MAFLRWWVVQLPGRCPPAGTGAVPPECFVRTWCSMDGTPDLNLLRVFAAVAEGKSFSGAARTLGLPKSSVSRAVARLEEELGVELLQRTTHVVSLGARGEALLRKIAPHLSALEDAASAL